MNENNEADILSFMSVDFDAKDLPDNSSGDENKEKEQTSAPSSEIFQAKTIHEGNPSQDNSSIPDDTNTFQENNGEQSLDSYKAIITNFIKSNLSNTEQCFIRKVNESETITEVNRVLKQAIYTYGCNSDKHKNASIITSKLLPISNRLTEDELNSFASILTFSGTLIFENIHNINDALDEIKKHNLVNLSDIINSKNIPINWIPAINIIGKFNPELTADTDINKDQESRIITIIDSINTNLSKLGKNEYKDLNINGKSFDEIKNDIIASITEINTDSSFTDDVVLSAIKNGISNYIKQNNLQTYQDKLNEQINNINEFKGNCTIISEIVSKLYNKLNKNPKLTEYIYNTKDEEKFKSSYDKLVENYFNIFENSDSDTLYYINNNTDKFNSSAQLENLIKNKNTDDYNKTHTILDALQQAITDSDIASTLLHILNNKSIESDAAKLSKNVLKTQQDYDNKVTLFKSLDNVFNNALRIINATRKQRSFKLNHNTYTVSANPHTITENEIKSLPNITDNDICTILSARSTENDIPSSSGKQVIKSAYSAFINYISKQYTARFGNQILNEINQAIAEKKSQLTGRPVKQNENTQFDFNQNNINTPTSNDDIIGDLPIDSDYDDTKETHNDESYEELLKRLDSYPDVFKFGGSDDTTEDSHVSTADLKTTYPVVYFAIKASAIDDTQAKEAFDYVDDILSHEDENPYLAAKLKTYDGSNPTIIYNLLDNHTSAHGHSGTLGRKGNNSSPIYFNKKDEIDSKIVYPGDISIGHDPELWNKAVITEFGYPFINYGNGLIAAILHKSENPKEANKAYKRLKAELNANSSAVPYEVRQVWNTIAKNPIKLLKEFANPGKDTIYLNTAMVEGDELVRGSREDMVPITPISTSLINPSSNTDVKVTRAFLYQFYDILKIDEDLGALELYLKYSDMDVNEFENYLKHHHQIPPIYVLYPKKASYKIVREEQSWFGKLIGAISGKVNTALIATSCMGQHGGFIMPMTDVNTLFSTFTRK